MYIFNFNLLIKLLKKILLYSFIYI